MVKRIINCESCNLYLGEIRDAKLKIGMISLCISCEKKRKAQLVFMSNIYAKQTRPNPLDFLKDIFG